MASAIPGASRWRTSRVASGVTSRGANPVPPVVSTSDALAASSSIAAADVGGLVRDDTPLDLEAVLLQELVEDVPAAVLALARMNAVGDGEDGGLHAAGSFVFSTSLSPVISISLSIAFAMS